MRVVEYIWPRDEDATDLHPAVAKSTPVWAIEHEGRFFRVAYITSAVAEHIRVNLANRPGKSFLDMLRANFYPQPGYVSDVTLHDFIN